MWWWLIAWVACSIMTCEYVIAYEWPDEMHGREWLGFHLIYLVIWPAIALSIVLGFCRGVANGIRERLQR